MTDLTTRASTLRFSDRKFAVPQSPGKSRNLGQLTLMAEAEPSLHILPENAASASDAVIPPCSFEFPRLPTEIRLQVYRWLLVSKARVKITKTELPKVKTAPRSDQQIQQFSFHHDLSNNDIFPQIITTSHGIHDEAKPILYSRNIWHFVVNKWFQTFLQHIGPENASSIRYCHLRGYALDVPEWSLAIAPCMMMNRLRTFEISLSSSDGRRPRGHSERIPGEEGKTMKALLYMRMLLQVHPSLRAVIRTKVDGGSSACSYNLMLVSEEYRMTGAVSMRGMIVEKKLTNYRTDTLILKPRWPLFSKKVGVCTFQCFSIRQSTRADVRGAVLALVGRKSPEWVTVTALRLADAGVHRGDDGFKEYRSR